MSRTGEVSRLPPLAWEPYGPGGIPLHMCRDWEGNAEGRTPSKGLRRTRSIGEFIPYTGFEMPDAMEDGCSDSNTSLCWGEVCLSNSTKTEVANDLLMELQQHDKSTEAEHVGRSLGHSEEPKVQFDSYASTIEAGELQQRARTWLQAELGFQDEACAEKLGGGSCVSTMESLGGGSCESTMESGSSEGQADDSPHGSAKHKEETTRMVQNIPRQATRDELVQFLDKKFGGLYDFCHMPRKFDERSNLGYAFVNFVTEEAAIAFTNALHRSFFPGYPVHHKQKPLRVTGARVQGRSSNIQMASSKKMSRIRSARLRPLALEASS